MTLNVIFQNDLTDSNAPSIEQFQSWTDAVFQQNHTKLPKNTHELCIRIVDEAESSDLNQTYRKKSGPTNVLSFPNKIEPNSDDESLGDIAICEALVVSKANAQRIPIEHHWAHLTVHGVLHLLGYDHIDEKDAIEMEHLEIQILKTLNIENPYQESLDEKN